MTIISTSEAAKRLGVSVRHVQNLIVQGRLKRSKHGYVTADSLEALLAVRAANKPRPGRKRLQRVGPLALRQRARRARRKSDLILAIGTSVKQDPI